MGQRSRTKFRFPILMYHRIESGECPIHDKDEARYAVPLEDFQWQMDVLKEAGLRAITVEEAAREIAMPGGDLHLVVLSFDDGNRSDFVHVLPILRRHSLKATFFLTAERVGEGKELENSMVDEMVVAGMEVGSHGLTHRFLPLLNKEGKLEECRRSKEILGMLAGREILSFSPPGGRLDSASIRAIEEAGYKVICTSEFGFNKQWADPMSLRRIPITRSTSKGMFLSILRGKVLKVAHLYVRYHALSLLRSALGERTYTTLRSKAARR